MLRKHKTAANMFDEILPWANFKLLNGHNNVL